MLEHRTAMYLLLVATVAMQVAIFFRISDRGLPSPRETVREVNGDVVIDLTDMPIQGAKEATIGMIEFSDFECPFCRRHTKDGVFDQIRETLIASGTIQYAHADLPLAIHPNAYRLAVAAICVGEQRDYWAMHGELFSLDSPATPDNLLATAESLGADMDKFHACVDSSSYPSARIESDRAKAHELDITGTPGFAIGRLRDGRLEVHKTVFGAQPFSTFEGIVAELMEAM